MYILSPSIYAADYMKLQEQIEIMERMNIKRLHVDIMDGDFVPNLSFGPDFVQALRTGTYIEFDVHLMIKNPIRFIQTFAEAGSDIITVHCESCEKVTEVVDAIHFYRKRAGVALNPETGLDRLPPELWDKADVIQIMTVEPGLKGQHFISPMLSKIQEAYSIINRTGRNVDIEVDGDITVQHLREVLLAGANVVVAGKALFHGNLEENIRKYQIAGLTRGEMAANIGNV